MDKKVLIEVCGVKDGIMECNCCGCGCSCNCGASSIIIGEKYDELVDYFKESQLRDRVNIKFIDLVNDKFDNFEAIADMLERGFEPPFIAIDNEIKLYGSISNELIYEYAEEALENESGSKFI